MEFAKSDLYLLLKRILWILIKKAHLIFLNCLFSSQLGYLLLMPKKAPAQTYLEFVVIGSNNYWE